MFKIQSEENKTINWPVKVEVAIDGGKTQKYEFTGVFKLLSDDAREALELAHLEAPGEAPADSEAAPPAVAGKWKEDMIDQIMLVMVGWKGVVDDKDQPLDFNRDTLRAAARGPRGVSVLRAINVAVSQVNTGAAAKN